MDVNQAIQEVVALARGELCEDAVTVRTALAGDLPPVLGDRVQLRQVMLNLVMNGIEAMTAVADRPRELLIRTEIDRNQDVCIAVLDAGIGLDHAGIDRIFEAF